MSKLPTPARVVVRRIPDRHLVLMRWFLPDIPRLFLLSILSAFTFLFSTLSLAALMPVDQDFVADETGQSVTETFTFTVGFNDYIGSLDLCQLSNCIDIYDGGQLSVDSALWYASTTEDCTFDSEDIYLEICVVFVDVTFTPDSPTYSEVELRLSTFEGGDEVAVLRGNLENPAVYGPNLTIETDNTTLEALPGESTYTTIVLSNDGDGYAENLLLPVVSLPLSIDANSEIGCSGTLAPGAACAFDIIFSPLDSTDSTSAPVPVVVTSNEGAYSSNELLISAHALSALPVISLSATTYSAPEGSVSDPGSVLITLTSDTELQDQVTVYFETIPGDATAGIDYVDVGMGSVVMAAGSSTAEFSIQLIGDDIPEPEESFEVLIGGSDGCCGVDINALDGASVGNYEASVAIENDDEYSPANLVVQPAETTLDVTGETSAGPVVYIITNTGETTAEILTLNTSSIGLPDGSNVATTTDCIGEYDDSGAGYLDSGASCEFRIDSIDAPTASGFQQNFSVSMALTYLDQPEYSDNFGSTLNFSFNGTVKQPTLVAGTFTLSASTSADVSGYEDAIGSFDITLTRSIADSENQIASLLTVPFSFHDFSDPVDLTGDLSASSLDTGFSNGVTPSLTWAKGEVGSKTITFTVAADSRPEPEFEAIVISYTVGDNSYIGRDLLMINDDYAAAALSVTPQQLAFGTPVEVGDTAQQTFQVTLQNTLSSDVVAGSDISVIAFVDTVPFVVTSEDCPALLAPGQSASCAVTLAFSPVAVVEHSQVDLPITYNDGQQQRSAYLTVEASSISAPEPGTISFDGTSSRLAEGGAAHTIKIRRNGGSDGQIAARLNIGGSAVAGADFNILSPDTDSSGQRLIVFADGAVASQEIVIQLLEDFVVEGDETISLSLSDSTVEGQQSDVIGNPESTQLVITDSTAPGVIEFSNSQWVFNELDGVVQVVVSRSGGSDGPQSVDYLIADGTAVRGVDFNDVSNPVNTLSWSNGDAENKAINIALLVNEAIDPSKSFTITLLDPQDNSSIEANTAVSDRTVQATVTIRDLTQPSVISLATASATVDEGNDLKIEVLRSGGDMIFQGAASVEYTVTASNAQNGAQGGYDFIEVYDGVLDWPAGDHSNRSIVVQTLSDAILNEGDETIFVNLRDPRPQDSHQLGLARATVTVAEATNPGELSFAQEAISVDEVNGEISLTVNRSAPAQGEVSVNYTTVNGTAFSPEDFTATNGTLDFASGETSKTIVVGLLRSNDIGDEKFSVLLSDATEGVAVAAAEIVVNIVDTSEPGVFSLVSNTFTVAESQRQVAVPVTRVGTDGPGFVSFSLTADSAESPADFVVLSPTDGVVRWEDGQTDKSIQITIVGDQKIEPTETFKLSLTGVTEGASIGGDPTAVITITDSSDRGQIRFSADSYAVSEADGSATITLVRSAVGSGPVLGDASVRFTASGATALATALAGADFEPVSGVLHWGDGESGERTFTVPIAADALIEGTETISIELSGAQPDSLQIDSSVTLSVADSSIVEAVQLSWNQSSELTVNEDVGTVSLQVARSGDTQSRVVLPYQVRVAGDTVSDADYSGQFSDLVWEPGDGSPKSIDITIENDTVVELTEKLSVALGAARSQWSGQIENPPAPPQVSTPTVNTVLSITDDEQRGPFSDPNTPLNPVYVLEILDGDNQKPVDLPEILAPMRVRVLSESDSDEPVPNVDIVWTIVPDPDAPATLVAEFVDEDGQTLGQTHNSVAGATGESDVRVKVLRRGFINVRVSPVVNIANRKVAVGRQLLSNLRNVGPEVPTQAGDALFTIRAGLQPTPQLSENAAKIARVIDIACDAIENDEVSVGSTFAAQDFVSLCDLENESEAAIRQATSRLLPEEVFTLGDSVLSLSNIQVTNVYSRINAIRAGQRSPIDASGLSMRLFGEQIPGSVTGAVVDAMTGGNSGSEFISDWAFFINGSASFGKADSTENEIGQDFDTRGITVGADYRLSSDIVVGGAFGHTQHDSKFSLNGGTSNLDGNYLSLFGTWYKEDTGYVDGVLEVGRNFFDIRRRVDLGISSANAAFGDGTAQFASGDTNATSVALTVGAGRDFNFDGLLVGSYARLSITAADVDSYNERAFNANAPGAGYVLTVNNHRVLSTHLSLGGQLSKAFSTKRGVFVPQFRLEAQFEAQDRPEGISANFQNDPGQTAFTIEGDENESTVLKYGLGGSAVFPNGKSGFLFYEGQAGHDTISQHSLKGGFRLEF